MKTTIKNLSLGICLTVSTLMNAQTKKPTISVLDIDAAYRNQGITPKGMGDLVRREVEKLDTFEVMDVYDLTYILKKNKIKPDSCYSKTCLTELGNILKSDKMLSGTLEIYSKTIVYTLRLIDVKTATIEKATTVEFISNTFEIQGMTSIIVRKLFGKESDRALVQKLTQRNDFDNEINNPHTDRLRLDGPRMGAVMYSGSIASRLAESKTNGGFDAFPTMFQFGYQFEKQYLNEGKVQALFEFVPMITGLDQGYFIPSISILHGVRSNINGWEFAFGPTFNLIQTANGYYDEFGKWQLEKTWNNNPDNAGIKNPNTIINRLDSRGDFSFHSAFVLAAGRTFKSGKLNIPVNAFAVPGRDGWRFGISFGFNAKNH